jgi:hypothetical protein
MNKIFTLFDYLNRNLDDLDQLVRVVFSLLLDDHRNNKSDNIYCRCKQNPNIILKIIVSQSVSVFS